MDESSFILHMWIPNYHTLLAEDDIFFPPSEWSWDICEFADQGTNVSFWALRPLLYPRSFDNWLCNDCWYQEKWRLQLSYKIVLSVWAPEIVYGLEGRVFFISETHIIRVFIEIEFNLRLIAMNSVDIFTIGFNPTKTGITLPICIFCISSKNISQFSGNQFVPWLTFLLLYSLWYCYEWNLLCLFSLQIIQGNNLKFGVLILHPVSLVTYGL